MSNKINLIEEALNSLACKVLCEELNQEYTSLTRLTHILKHIISKLIKNCRSNCVSISVQKILKYCNCKNVSYGKRSLLGSILPYVLNELGVTYEVIICRRSSKLYIVKKCK